MRSFKLHLFFSITLNLLLKNNFMELPAQRKSGSRDFSFIRQIQLEVSLGNLNLASYMKVFNCIVYKFRLLLPLVCLSIYLFIFFILGRLCVKLTFTLLFQGKYLLLDILKKVCMCVCQIISLTFAPVSMVTNLTHTAKRGAFFKTGPTIVTGIRSANMV